jgi:hypothetical protein
MSKEGWEFVQEYTEGDSQTGLTYHFMLKKMVDQSEKDDQDPK